MTMPKQLTAPSVTNARLVTKTSLTNPKKALALFMLLWYEGGKPAMLTYGKEQAPSKDGGIIDDRIVSQVRSFAAGHAIDLSAADVEGSLANNPLLISQIESLNAAFELIWHLGRFTFTVPGRALGAERTGGQRYRKRIDFTCNMDLIALVADGREDDLAGVLLSWLTNGGVALDAAMEERLLSTLATFAETSYYKTSKGDAGRVYAPSGVYDAILESADVVGLVDDGAEAQGPTRIFKTILKDGLNPNLVESGGNAARNPDVAADVLREYSGRAKTTISLSRIEVDEKEIGGSEVIANETDGSSEELLNLIYFGAPGTGKSYQLARKAEECFEDSNVRRVTFHPDYTYAQFVGCYKPYSGINDEGKHEVYYKYTFGPFLETYVDALQHPENSYLLVIEEINRANPAAVFGDVFQLLDRKADGTSEYPVRVSQDMGEELYLQLGYTRYDEQKYDGFTDSEQQKERIETIALPANMFIWATMNSADQGVFPMDTAFKRRWDFRYMGIDEGSDVIKGYRVPVGGRNRYVSWDALRTGINKVLLSNKVNEDKLLGPFFIAPSILADAAEFGRVFKNKVLLYLFEDAAKTKKGKVFTLGATATYSEICKDFDERGEGMFQNFETLTSYEPDTKIDGEGQEGVTGEDEV